MPDTVIKYFGDGLPVVNNNRELIISTYNSYALNAASTPEIKSLAWDFIKFMMNTDVNRDVEYSGVLFTHKEMFENTIRNSGIYAADEQFFYLIKLTERPMFNTTIYAHQFLFWRSNVHEYLNEFQKGSLTAEETATIIQSKMEAIFEEITIR